MTGEFVMTQDSAFASMLYDIHKKCWSEEMCKIYGINPKHLAKIVKCTDKVGELSKKAADELDLEPGTAVFGGGGDASLIASAQARLTSATRTFIPAHRAGYQP